VPNLDLMSEIGLILALGCALISGVAMLCKHRGAVDAPDVAMRSPLRSASALFRSRWWAVGFLLATLGWGLHAAALSMAPLSLVQAVIAGGLALLAVPARRWFGISLGTRDLVGLGLCAAGLAFLALTAGHGRESGAFTGSTMLAFEGGTLALGGVLLVASAHRRLVSRGWVLLAVAAGTSIGVSDVALKALAETVPAAPLSVLSPWTAMAIVGGIGGFLALARGLQLGEPVSVIVAFSASATLAAITGGVVVFGDPLGSDALDVIARSAAFVAVIGAAALLPLVPGRAGDRRVAPQPAA
jgi:multidrug transporter EmrE-like cation transporter